MTAIVFPFNPVVGQLFPDPPRSGAPIWHWDGARWNSVPVVGGPGPEGPPGITGPEGPKGATGPPGTGGTAELPSPWWDWTIVDPLIQGNGRRIGGTQAVGTQSLGDVGEYQQTVTVLSYLVQSWNGTIVSLQLTAGDWDVGGNFGIVTSGLVEAGIGVTATWGGTNDPFITGFGQPCIAMRNLWTNVRSAFAMPRARVSNSAMALVSLNLVMTAMAQVTLWGYMSARRTR